MYFLALLFYLSASDGRATSESGDKSTRPILFPTEYHFRGETTFLNRDIVVPFEIWYSETLNASRIDNYNSTNKKFYWNDDGDIKVYEVFPMSQDTLRVEPMCLPSFTEDKMKNFLPDTENYTYYGETTIDDKEVEIWHYSEFDGETIDLNIVHKLYVYREGDWHLPLRYEVFKYNAMSYALFSHLISIYWDYREPMKYELDFRQDPTCNDSIFFIDSELPQKIMPEDMLSLDREFRRFKEIHGKSYGQEEHHLRKKIFAENLRHIEEHNRKNLSYKMAVNEFTDYTQEELGFLTATRFEPDFEGTEPFLHSEEEVEEMAKDLPENFDLRIEGYISKIKHQGGCGSCWAFTTTAAVEGVLARRDGGRLLDLSEQSLVDCSWGFGNLGCRGGLINDAYKYVMKYGIPTEMDYGLYQSKDGSCHIHNMTQTYKIRGFGRVPVKSVNAMKVALYKYGPIGVGVHVGDKMVKYSSGIFYDPDCNKSGPNHGMVAVGYGVRDGVLYWILKNSYGEQWGEDGYLLISAENNNCHVLEFASYPIV